MSDARAEERHLAQRVELLTNIQVRQTTCPASRPGPCPGLAHLHHHAQIWRCPQQIHPEPHLHNTGCLWPLFRFIRNTKRQNEHPQDKKKVRTGCRVVEAASASSFMIKLNLSKHHQEPRTTIAPLQANHQLVSLPKRNTTVSSLTALRARVCFANKLLSSRG